MSVRITGPVPPGSVGRPQGRVGAKKTDESGSSADRGEKVELSQASAAAVATVKEAVRDLPDVDEARIAELREKIARGEYRADLRVVAERMIAEALVGR